MNTLIDLIIILGEIIRSHAIRVYLSLTNQLVERLGSIPLIIGEKRFKIKLKSLTETAMFNLDKKGFMTGRIDLNEGLFVQED